MFSFFKKKPVAPPAPPAPAAPPAPIAPSAPMAPLPAPADAEAPVTLDPRVADAARVPPDRGAPAAQARSAEAAPATQTWPDASVQVPVAVESALPEVQSRRWFDKLRGGLRKTGSSLTQVFTGTQIDDALYEELEAALLMADAGVKATEFLLVDLKRRVKESKATDPVAVKGLLADAVAALLTPLEQPLRVGEHVPTVIMVVGVNGAGKTTSVGKLTRHLMDAQQKVLLAAADTFRAAAREQLAVWAQRADGHALAMHPVEIVSQQDGDPAAVTFDAVIAGKARGCDVVIADTAGRLTTQSHLMDELKNIRRVIGKAQAGAPHEVLLVVDGNTGQNALTQVQMFDAALQLTGLIITKLDGTAKGGVLAAVGRWSQAHKRDIPVYFIGVGEQLEDLQTFRAREF
ncbi:MAG: signal recognition particle-docking protein FtsY, partial [Burkholderiaceae bacterium]